MKFSDPYLNVRQMDITPGMHVADFGSGIGHHSHALVHVVGKNGKIYAIDVQAEHLSKLHNEARNKGWDNIEIIQGDLESQRGSGLRPSSVDRIIVSNILFQVDSPLNIALEARRVVKPEGIVAVIDWVDNETRIGPPRHQMLAPEYVIRMFEAAGFQVIARMDAGIHHYGFLFKAI